MQQSKHIWEVTSGPVDVKQQYQLCRRSPCLWSPDDCCIAQGRIASGYMESRGELAGVLLATPHHCLLRRLFLQSTSAWERHLWQTKPQKQTLMKWLPLSQEMWDSQMSSTRGATVVDGKRSLTLIKRYCKSKWMSRSVNNYTSRYRHEARRLIFLSVLCLRSLFSPSV